MKICVVMISGDSILNSISQLNISHIHIAVLSATTSTLVTDADKVTQYIKGIN